MSYNKESFCTQPWINTVVQPGGEFKVCCLANDGNDSGVAVDDNGVPMHILTHSFADVINSKVFREHRLQLSRNEQPELCKNCYQKEKSVGGFSVRQSYNNLHQIFPEVITPESAKDVTSPDGRIDLLPIALDLRFGNLCNYKCIMCSPKYSSLWEEEWLEATGRRDSNLGVGYTPSKAYYVIKDERNRPKVDAQRWWETDTWWERFEEVADRVRFIYFTGGEPLLVPMHDEILAHLINRGRADQIMLDYDTNLSVINPKLFELIKQFKKVRMRVSVDETDDRYHIVRNPGNFEQLLKNLDQLKQSGLGPHNINGCIGVSTIYAPFRLQKLANDLGVLYSWRFLYAPEDQSLIFLPDEAKKEIIEVYRENNIGPVSQSVCGFLEQHMGQHRPDLMKRYVEFMDRLDKLRGTNWKATLPDVYDLLQRHCSYAFQK